MRLRTFLFALAITPFVVLGCSGSTSTLRHSSASTSTSTAPQPTVAPTDPVQSQTGGFVPAPLRWHECGSDECATLKVPRDYANPGGAQVSLFLKRVPAGDTSRRIGSIVVNPGGPGAPGADFAASVASRLPESVTSRFDIVGWDPRGTGASTSVDCGNRLDYLFDADAAPDTPRELQTLEDAGRRFASDCATRSGALVPHLGSRDTVRDLEIIRAALGEPKLSYVGFSFGTYYGALYAEMFPDRVRALVLDGAIDPALPLDEVDIQQANGFGRSLDGFMSYCAASSECAFHHDGNPRPAFDALRARVDREPLRTRSGRVFGPTQLDIAVAALLYSGRPAYSTIGNGLHQVEDGDPSSMLRAFDLYVGRDSDGTYDSSWAAFTAASCADGPNLPVADFEALQARAATAAPDFGATNVGLGYACSYWPVPGANAVPTPVHAAGAPPIVVIGTTGDPATPIEWARNLVSELGSGRLVTVEGTTHTSLLNDNRCLDAAVATYLVELAPPAPNSRCRG
jgi:pimeloyl-ACP methyl ester carboxylesterase